MLAAAQEVTKDSGSIRTTKRLSFPHKQVVRFWQTSLAVIGVAIV